MSAALCFTPWYEPIGLPNAMRLCAYSVVMSSTFCAPPHISAQSATIARSTTRARGAQPESFWPSSAPAGTLTSLSFTSESLRVWSIVGRSLTDTPRAFVGTTNRLTPSSGFLPSRVRATTTSAWATCASGTNSFVPDSVKPPPLALAGVVTARVRLRPRQRHARLAPGDLREPLLLLRVGAGLEDREPAEQRREEWPRHHGAAHLFHEHGEVDEAEPGAAVGLGIDEAQPALLGELGPELRREARVLGHARADELGRALVLEELPRRRAEHLLVGVEPEIH